MRILHLLVAILLGAALVSAPVAQADTTTVYESLTWNPTTGNKDIADVNASGGTTREVRQNATGTLSGNTEGIVSIRVRARGAQYVNVYPAMRVTVNGTVVATTTVNNTSYADFTYNVDTPAGTNTVQLTHTNGACDWWGCNRVLYVDTVSITFKDGTTTTTETTTETTTPTTPPPPGPLQPGDDFVAMGDSYGSGEGADRSPLQPTRDNSVYGACGRSTYAAPNRIAQQLQLDLTFVACGTASIANITTTGLFGEPPQIERLTPETKLVTVIIGGNDAALMWMLEFCVKSGNCVTSDFWGNWYITQMNDKINKVQPQIEGLVRMIAQRSPNATIRFSGYPYIVAPPGQPVGTCNWLNSGEQAMFADATVRTNNAIRKGVEKVAAELPARDIRYADPLAPGSPFNPADNSCSTAVSRYMNAYDGQQGYWHPNIPGQDDYAWVFIPTL